MSEAQLLSRLSTQESTAWVISGSPGQVGANAGTTAPRSDLQGWVRQALDALAGLRHSGALSEARSTQVVETVVLLGLWGVPPPSDIGCPDDEEFTLLWSGAGVVAALTVEPERVLAYAYNLGSERPLRIGAETLTLAQLNSFARILGS